MPEKLVPCAQFTVSTIMIQRIQSIFILLVAVAMGVTLLFPIWEKIGPGLEEAVSVTAFQITHYKYSADAPGEITEVIKQDSLWYAVLLAGLSIVVALISLFSFKNRLNQIKLNALNALLIGGYVVSTLFATFRGDEWLAIEGEGNYLPGFYIPLVALLCNMLANRFIRKDDLLVRSADRFR